MVRDKASLSRNVHTASRWWFKDTRFVDFCLTSLNSNYAGATAFYILLCRSNPELADLITTAVVAKIYAGSLVFRVNIGSQIDLQSFVGKFAMLPYGDTYLLAKLKSVTSAPISPLTRAGLATRRIFQRTKYDDKMPPKFNRHFYGVMKRGSRYSRGFRRICYSCGYLTGRTNLKPSGPNGRMGKCCPRCQRYVAY